VLAAGEPGWASDTRELRIGDGVTPWLDLPAIGGVTVTDHNSLTGRDAVDAHPIDAITGLADSLAAIDARLDRHRFTWWDAQISTLPNGPLPEPWESIAPYALAQVHDGVVRFGSDTSAGGKRSLSSVPQLHERMVAVTATATVTGEEMNDALASFGCVDLDSGTNIFVECRSISGQPTVFLVTSIGESPGVAIAPEWWPLTLEIWLKSQVARIVTATGIILSGVPLQPAENMPRLSVTHAAVAGYQVELSASASISELRVEVSDDLGDIPVPATFWGRHLRDLMEQKIWVGDIGVSVASLVDGRVVAPSGLATDARAVATGVGSLVQVMEVYDPSGALVGYVPIYDGFS
jgi:hypothetical protein